MDRGNATINTVVDQTAFLATNNSLIYDEIFDNNNNFMGDTPKVNFREHIPVHFFSSVTTQDQAQINWNSEISFVFVKQRLLIRGMNVEINWSPGSLIDSAGTGLPRNLAAGEYIQMVPYVPFELFQEQYNILYHGGNTRVVQKLYYTTDILRKQIGMNPNDYQQWQYNIGAGPSWTPTARENAFFAQKYYTFPLTEIYWDQDKHDQKSPFIPSAFTSQFELHFVLTDPSYLVQTNIVNKNDIVLPVPTITLSYMMEEVGPTLFNAIKQQKYFSQPSIEMHFVHIEIPKPIAVPIGATSLTVDMTKLTTKDVRDMMFFLAPASHQIGASTSSNLAPYALDPFNFANCLQINSFNFTVQNTNATIVQSDQQNRQILRNWYNKRSITTNDYLYLVSFTEFPWDRNVSAGSSNLNTKSNFNLVLNFPATTQTYYLWIYFETENLLVQQNSDIAPVLAI